MHGFGGRQLIMGRFGVRIAAMVLNRPPAGKPAPTLIVCMVALLGQWNQEIGRASCRERVCLYV